MAKNIDHIQHVKSNVVIEGKPKLPQPEVLVDGELAVNYSKGYETISLKNTSGEVVTFSSDNYYSEQKLGSAFTGANSAVTVTDVLENLDLGNEVEVNSGNTPSGETIEIWVDESVEEATVDVYTKNEVDALLDDKAATSALTEHTSDSGIHVQLTDKANWNAKLDSSAIADFFDGAEYELSGTTHVINFYHGEDIKATINADDFIKDGMVDTVEVKDVEISGETVTCLVITFNTDAGKEDINIPLSDIFDPSLYYTKTEIDNQALWISGSGANSIVQKNSSGASSAQFAVSEGSGTTAGGSFSHAEGFGTITTNPYEHASGVFNVSSAATQSFGDAGNTLFSIGDGLADDNRRNAFEIRQNGDIYIRKGVNTNVKLQDEITPDQVIDSTTSASTKAVSTNAVYGFVTSYTPSITVDQVLDDTTSASTNPVSSKAVYDAVTDNELVWTNAFVTLSGIVGTHTANTEIHVTAADKTAWNGAVTSSHTHSNKSALDAITGNVGTMAYENANSYSSATEVNTALGNKANTSDIVDFFDDAKYEDSGTSKVINFYHGNTIKATINADDFIVDGMISGVTLESKSGTTYLVINWNTDAGIQTTELNIGDIFEADNYYDKDDIDDLVGSGFTSSSITEVIIENENIVSTALNDLDERKLDATAYTPTDLTNYYTKSETSGATEISDALSGKVDTNTFDTIVGSGYTNTTITEVIENMDNAIAAALTDLDDKIGDIESILATI